MLEYVAVKEVSAFQLRPTKTGHSSSILHKLQYYWNISVYVGCICYILHIVYNAIVSYMLNIVQL